MVDVSIYLIIPIEYKVYTNNPQGILHPERRYHLNVRVVQPKEDRRDS
jgi:hypothetical protein